LDYIGVLLAITFLFSTAGLFAFVWSLSSKSPAHQRHDAEVIFGEEGSGHVEEPASTEREQQALQGLLPRPAKHRDTAMSAAELAALDQSSRTPFLTFLYGGLLWLLIGSFAGLVASLKLHFPDWLVAQPELTFGRIRTLHLTAVVYGWGSMTGVAMALWLFPRLLRTPLVGARFAVAGSGFWHAGVLLGAAAIVLGWNGGMEFLEIPKVFAPLIVLGGALVGIPLVLTLLQRRVHHLYVSVWYLSAAVLWFPILYLVANLPKVHFGVQAAVVNWWFGHNVLGYWVTPVAIGTAYYIIPKVLGKPIASYNLSLVGFWALALFYGQAGVHHLVGGPIPTWLVTVGVVASIMMLVPVIAFGVNQWLTMRSSWRALRYSPSLRFVIVGAVGYVLSSVEGTMEALRSVSTVAHFTHFTVGHAHLGLYTFFSFVMFGGVYFALPRVVQREWPYPKLIGWHFWLAFIGMAIYIIALSVGGWLQGLALLDAKRPFMESVALTLPYLQLRSVGGSLMLASHLVFVTHAILLVFEKGPQRVGAAVFGRVPT
jgi:cytochrome c oxidase cbb3-type subunit 1